MGYSHRFSYQPANPEFRAGFAAALPDIGRLLAELGDVVPLVGYDYRTDRWAVDAPLVTEAGVVFNGAGDDGYESFVWGVSSIDTPADTAGLMAQLAVLNDLPAGAHTRYTKTEQRGYDVAVCVVLLHAALTVPTVDISSDGRWDREWVTAREHYRALTGVDVVDAPANFNRA